MSQFPTKEKALGMYLKMYEIRKYEERLYYLFLEGEMPGTLHQSHGEEACAVGMLYDLRKDDWMASTHRPAGHDLAKGVSLRSMMCEMFGKAEGCCGGKGGAMHTGDISVGALTANAIVGGNLPIAAGVGLAFKMQKKDNVVVCFFGDGASNQGVFYESMNMAAAWDLPVIYLCECNDWAIGTNFERVTKEHDISRRAAAFGLPGVLVDGFNVLEVYKAVSEAAERARRGEGPTLIEAKYMRMAGHHVGDDQNYRTREDLDSISVLYELDPIKRLGELLRANGIEDSVLENIAARQRAAIDEAVRFASEDCSEPPVSELYDDVFSDIRVE